MKNQFGFSLVETICCTVIIALLSVFSTPAVLSMQAGIEMRSMLREMMADLQLAKLEAVKENHYVVINISQNGYKVFVDNGAGESIAADWHCHPDERIVVDKNVSKIAAISSNFPHDQIRFNGISGMTPGTIRIAGKNDEHFNIVISRAGRIRIEKDS